MADLNASADAASVESPAADAPAAEPSLRDTLDAAFDQVESDDVSPGRARDDAGRFAKAPAAPGEAPSGPVAPSKPVPQGVTSAAPRPGAQTGQEAAGAAAPELKAPAQWKPEARERWAGTDPLIKAEINRREREFQTHLQQSAGLREFVNAFENVVRPYEMFIRAENSNPLAAVSNLFQTAAQLRVGTPQTKAMMVAGLCQQYAIDLSMLDTALAQRYGVATQGVNPAAMVQQPQQFHDPRVDQLLMARNAEQQAANEREAYEIQSQTAQFAGQHEFFEDVRMDMADMIEMAARRGIVLPVKEAYEKACALNPEVSKILAQRNGAGNARATTQAALRAKRAASSVKGESSPHGSTAPQSDSLRGAIEAAFEQAGNSRL